MARADAPALAALLLIAAGFTAAAPATAALRDLFIPKEVREFNAGMVNSVAFSIRPDFSQPVMAPDGRHVALMMRMPRSVTTLVIADVSGAGADALFRVVLPELRDLLSFAWVNDRQLVAWFRLAPESALNEVDGASVQDEQSQRARISAMVVDIGKRSASSRIALDLPADTELVRAPYQDDRHVLIKECSRSLSAVAQLGSRQYCQLKSWDVERNRARAVAREIAIQPVRFLADQAGEQLRYEARARSGSIEQGRWDEAQREWQVNQASGVAALLEAQSSSELEHALAWSNLRAILPPASEPAARVIVTPLTQRPVALQFTAPKRHTVSMHEKLDGVLARLTRRLPDYAVELESVAENLDALVISVQNATTPKGYMVWRRSDNRLLWLTASRTLKPETMSPTEMEYDWLIGDTRVAVTLPRAGVAHTGIVVMPLLASDDLAERAMEFDPLAQWLAFNGLTVVKVPVGVPAAKPAAERGAAWWRQVAARLKDVQEFAREQTELLQDGKVCLYGEGTAAYVSLAAHAFGSGIECVVAYNARLDPARLRDPYAYIETLEGREYFNRSSAALAEWTAVYGDDSAAAAPASWQYGANSEVLLAFEMYTADHALSAMSGAVDRAIGASGGRSRVYDARTRTTTIDRWRQEWFEKLAEFLVPENRVRGKVIIDDLPESPSRNPATAPAAN